MSQQKPDRRTFLKTTSATAGTVALAPALLTPAVHPGHQEMLKLGLVGCGGRGEGAVLNALNADPNVKLVAIGDTFRDRALTRQANFLKNEELASRATVSDDQVFDGFDSFKKVIDASDVVILATPPHFRPEHLAYAVEQNKHCFVEKPIAVDAPGVRSVQKTCQSAKEKGLSIVSGLCWRYDLGIQETMRKILEEKAIGEIVSIESSYNSGTLWHRGDQEDWSRMEYQIRNWLYFNWLSGDHIVEQAIHSLDKTAWLMGDVPPVKAMALGGRQQRTDAKWGDIFDHFTVFYEYASGQRVYFTCRQQADTDQHTDELVLGTKGQAQVIKHRIKPHDGEKWRYRGPKPSMYVNEHVEFFKSIRSGQPINNGHYMCNSTMLAIMGRMAAYSGKTLTWEECINSEQRLGPKEYNWGDVPASPVAIPGVTKVL